MKWIRHQSKLIHLFAVFIVLYIWRTLAVTPRDVTLQRYHLSRITLDLLALTVAIPYILIWLVALAGYLSFRRYGRSIRHSADGAAVMLLVYGLFWLVLWLPVNTLVGGALNDIAQAHPSVTTLARCLTVYINLAILAISYVLLYLGARKTLGMVRTDLPAKPSMLRAGFYVLYALLAALYIYTIFRHTSASHPAVSYLPDWVLLLTVIVPRLILWFLGVQAIGDIYLYARFVSGSLYRAAFRYLAIGLSGVTMALILLAYFTTLEEGHPYSLGRLLGILYVLLIIAAAGFVTIMVGTAKLRRIEEA